MKTCFKLCACTYSSAVPLRSYRLTLAFGGLATLLLGAAVLTVSACTGGRGIAPFRNVETETATDDGGAAAELS